MYCKICGTKNTSYAHYCVHDGEPLKLEASPVGNQYKHLDFCSKCGTKTSGYFQFCTSCGCSVEQVIVTKRDVKIPSSVSPALASISSSTQRFTETAKQKATKWFSHAEWKIIIQGAGAFLVTWLLLMGILFMIVKDNLENSFKTMSGSEEWFNIAPFFDYFNFFRITSLLSSRHFEMSVSVVGEEAGIIHLKMGFVFILAILFVSAGVGSYLVLRRLSHKNWTWIHFGRISILFGLFYAIGSSIIFMIGSSSKSVQNEYFSASLDVSFHPFISFFENAVYAILISFIVLLLISRFQGTTHELLSTKYGEIVFRGVTSFLLGLIVVVLFLSIFLKINVSKAIDEEAEFSFPSLLLAEVSTTMYSLYNFGTVSVQPNDEYTLFSFGVFSKDTQEKEEMIMEFTNAVSDYKPAMLTFNWNTLYWLMLVPAALFFYSGRKMTYVSRQIPIKEMALYSLVYSMMLSLLNYWISCSLTVGTFGSIERSFTAGPDLIPTFMTSFLFAFILSILGAYTKQIANRRGV